MGSKASHVHTKGSQLRRVAHPGFAAVRDEIAAREGVSEDRAAAILAAETRRASSAARRANPRLNRVKG